MQMRAELMDARYAVLGWFFDPMHFPKELVESAGLLVDRRRMSLNVLIAWIHSKFSEQEVLEVRENRMHYDRISDSANRDRVRQKCGETLP